MLPIGDYVTKAGSKMRVHGKYGKARTVDFDWLEEGACIDCVPHAYDEDGQLVWECDYCGGGRADLMQVQPNAGVKRRRSRPP